MKPLPLRPLPISGEALSDYLERLADANGYEPRELWAILDRGECSCVFRAKLDTQSKANWTPIPRQIGHPVQRKLDSNSASNWTV